MHSYYTIYYQVCQQNCCIGLHNIDNSIIRPLDKHNQLWYIIGEKQPGETGLRIKGGKL